MPWTQSIGLPVQLSYFYGGQKSEVFGHEIVKISKSYELFLLFLLKTALEYSLAFGFFKSVDF